LATTRSAFTKLATCSEEAEKSCGSAPIGIRVWAVPPAHSRMSPSTSPSIVVVPIARPPSLAASWTASVASLSELAVPQPAITRPAAKRTPREVLADRMVVPF
jgi:hypothetical protein